MHLVPSSILHSGKQSVIGNGVVVDPEQLLTEIDELESANVEVRGNLFISEGAHMVFPYHKLIDSLLKVLRVKARLVLLDVG